MLDIARLRQRTKTFSNIELLIPKLQRRIFKKEYRPGTLREKFFGKGARLGETHPAHAHRHSVRVPA